MAVKRLGRRRPTEHLESLSRDLHHVARRLARSPRFVAVALLNLSVGIGVTTAAFTLIDAVLLRPFATPAGDRLANVCLTIQGSPHPDTGLTDARLERLRDFNLQSIESIASTKAQRVAVSGPDASQIAFAEFVGGSYFHVVGAADRRPRHLGVRRTRWRRTRGHQHADLATDVRRKQQRDWGNAPGVRIARDPRSPSLVFARMQPNVTFRQADAELRAASRDLEPGADEYALTLLRPEEAIMPRPLAAVLWIAGVMAILLCAAVLAIAATNVGNLLLARISSRAADLAIRLAIGASPRHVFQLVIVESAVLAAASGGVGALLAVGICRELGRVVFPAVGGLTLRYDLAPDWRVFAFAVAAAAATVAVTGIAPAWHAARVDPIPILAGAGPAATPLTKNKRLVLAGQLALSTVLLVLSALLVRSTIAATSRTSSVDTDSTVLGRLDFRLQHFEEDQARPVLDRILAAVRESPQFGNAALATGLPSPRDGAFGSLVPEGRESETGSRIYCKYLSVSPAFFSIIRLQVRGRAFDSRDSRNARATAIVSESLAQATWPGRDPLGMHATVWIRGERGPTVEVVGVAPDADVTSSDPVLRRFLYLPLEQQYSPAVAVMARGAGQAEALVGPLRDAVARAAPELALFDVRTARDDLGLEAETFRMAAVAVSVLGIAGLAIALTGLYAISAFIQTQRRREFAIMKPLGARDRDLYRKGWTEVRDVLVWGVPCGLVLALAASTALRHVLVGFRAYDGPTLVVVSIALSLTAALTWMAPLRGAARRLPQDSLTQL
jgi:putative ABC transport system permease protein